MEMAIAVIMASTGLDAKSAKARLEKAMDELDSVPEYKSVIAPPAKPAEVKPDEAKP